MADPHRGDVPPDQKLVRKSEAFFRALLWLLVVYSFAMWAVAMLDWFRHPLAPSPYAAFGGSPAFRALALFVGAPVTALLGGLILRRQRQNLIGLLIMAWGAGFASWGISAEIEPALYLLVSLPVAAWWTVLIVTPYYFPDGHAHPSWLSPFLPAIMVLALVQGGTAMLASANLDYVGQPANPFFVTGALAVHQLLTAVYSFLMLPVIAGVFISPLLRYRRADFRQRQQIKWFAWWSMIIFTPYLVFYFTLGFIYSEPTDVPPLPRIFIQALVGLIGLFPPIIIAFAILRHRLYDIDLIIRKTLVYAVLSGTLALVYLGSVVLLQTLFGRLTGEQSPLILVISTLLIAALFAPLRRRVQEAIDRRFYRRKYNAAQILAAFAQTARDEVDLDALTAELVRTVQETMQPEQMSLWLKPGASWRPIPPAQDMG